MRYCLLVLCCFAVCGHAAPEMKTFSLGRMDTATPAVMTTEGACAVPGSGMTAINGRDDATFTGLETDAPAFTFIARIAKVEGLTATSKFGLGARAGAWNCEKALHLCYSAQEKGLQWFLRHSSRMRDDEGGLRCFAAGVVKGPDAAEGLWLRLVRRYPAIEMAWSRDGATWTAVPYHAALIAPTVLVGMQVTAGGAQPMTVTFDHIGFTVDAADGLDTPATFVERNEGIVGRYVLAKVDGDTKGPFNAFLLMPKAMAPAGIRAILFTPRTKEVLFADNTKVIYDGKDRLRKPTTMADFEGTCDLPNLHPFCQGLAEHGIVRIGGVFGAADYAKAVARLAVVSGIAHLPNVPVLGDATVGADRCLAALGGAGDDLQTPYLTAFNTSDGGASGVFGTVAGARAKHALWACAPLWTVGHKPGQGEAIVFPFLLDVLRLRLPADADPTKGAPKLIPVREEDGWLGLTDTWNGNNPQVVPFKDHKTGPAVWLPSEGLAQLWRATVANHPRTVIQFPTFDGAASFNQSIYPYWHNSTLKAGVPLEIVASGPTGADAKVTYYEGARALKVVKTHGTPYRVTCEALAPGIHSIHAESVVAGMHEVSHPVLVTVVKAEK